MKTLSILFGLTGLTFASAAWSADCEATYSTDQLLTDLIEAEELLKTEDKGAILAKSKAMEGGLPCMNETLPPILIGRVYRAIAGGLFYAGEEDRGRAWFTTAVEVDPSYIYGIEDIGANHPVRQVYDQLRMAPPTDPVALPGKMLREGPKHLLDGKKLREAAARTGRPHLYQMDEGGIKSWVIEGNALPDEALTGAKVADAKGGQADPKPPKAGKNPKTPKEKVAKAPKDKPAKTPKEKPVKEAKPGKDKGDKEAVAKAPKDKPAKEPKTPKEKPEKVAKTPKVKPVKEKTAKTKPAPVGLSQTVILRDRPPEQIPLIVTGALAIVGSGVLYALSVNNKSKFGDISSWKVGSSNPTNDDPALRTDLIKKQQAANRLFLGSFAVAAAGISTLTYGIIIDARSGRVMPTFNVRF